MNITPADIKKLRETTGAGLMDCKNALQEFNGDFEEAIKGLRKKGAAVAAKKGQRKAGEGVIGEYIHFNKRIGVLVEVNCETDFVARNEKFTEFAHELAVHICANNPRWKTPDEVPAKVLDDEKEVFKDQLLKEGKPEKIHEKIIEGKLNKFYETNCLMQQPYSGDDSITVADAVQNLIQATGENIQVARFARFEVGGTQE